MSDMRTAHEIVRDYKARHAVDEAAFAEWFADGRFSEDMANVHDSRHLALLEDYVEQRDAAA